ncbi:hypothetical protein [Haloprofundus halobius]|nr:hypothetical protein [Haloprofundus halobius]
MDQIEEDIEILKDAGQDDLVNEFLNRFGRIERLEREIDHLRDQLDEDQH